MIPGTIATIKDPIEYPATLDALHTYGIFTRASAKAAGVPDSCMPAFNKNWPVKNTLMLDVDDTIRNDFHTLAYGVIGDTQQIILPAKMEAFLTEPGQAGTLNLPDEVTPYPRYEAAPTTAYEQDGSLQLTMDPDFLSTLEEAQELASALGANPQTVSMYQPAGGPDSFSYVYPATETRRYYTFVDSRNQFQIVGFLLRQQGFSAGNGVWVDNGTFWAWRPKLLPALFTPTGPIFPQPMRALKPGENIRIVEATVPMLFNS